ncbi:class I fructose-bisphosphate aldolase [Lujinxingia litoralis]|uniref:fructose-bisphosphate aldolase n=1 Tax=Lujinxingia litoralis TaxID=2211119 RepID=A0A328C819_9DELT|nr:class I fructose-bisphosphate aldolase [Lujinxingia litoralis]RAL24737.1 class I fructose-bisphosphate aldolase [Lujinxingia litoralis]
MTTSIERIVELLGSDADNLLGYESKTISKERLSLPGPDFVERVFMNSDRSPRVLRSLQALYDGGRLGGTGYLSILPVDQGIEHSAGASFAPNPDYFDPAAIVELAIEGGCNAVASTFGVLGMVARRYAHRIPFVVKLNHNELLSYPNTYDQIMFGTVEQAHEMGAVAVGATIYFGSPESNRQIVDVARAFARAHELGMATILWCYTRNNAFKTGGNDYHTAADLTGQANHLGVTLHADIIKQKMPETNGGFQAVTHEDGSKFGRTHEKVYSELSSEHPIDLTRYQVANCYMGRAGLINSGGASGDNDLADAVRTAVINKRAGGTGLILGRKAFQRPRNEGIALLNAVQDVYLCDDVTIA